MVGEEDWVFRPMVRGFCRYESLLDGTLDLAAISTMNEVIDVEQENAARAQAAAAAAK
jgi:hypothetical protein